MTLIYPLTAISLPVDLQPEKHPIFTIYINTYIRVNLTAMHIYNKTFFYIGTIMFVGSIIWSSIMWRVSYMYGDLLIIVGIVYIVLAFKKTKESKN